MAKRQDILASMNNDIVLFISHFSVPLRIEYVILNH